MGLLTASALIKFASLVLIPLFFIYSFSHQSTRPKRLLYTIQASIISLALIIDSFAPFWAGLQTLQRFFEQIKYQRYSFNIFLHYFSSGNISSDQAKMLGLVLFGVCFLYALWLSSRDLSSLLKGCFITMFALLALSVTYVQPWYLIWPFMLAILIPQTEVSRAAMLIAYVGAQAGLVRQYIFPWAAAHHLHISASINSMVYVTFFLPSTLVWIAPRFRQILSQSYLALYTQMKRGPIVIPRNLEP
jgi:hypothetical protein